MISQCVVPFKPCPCSRSDVHACAAGLAGKARFICRGRLLGGIEGGDKRGHKRMLHATRYSQPVSKDTDAVNSIDSLGFQAGL